MNTNTQTRTSSKGMGFTGVLTIVFIILKLTGVISWSWIWVLSPLWLGTALGLTIFLIALMWMLIGEAVSNAKYKMKRRKMNK